MFFGLHPGALTKMEEEEREIEGDFYVPWWLTGAPQRVSVLRYDPQGSRYFAEPGLSINDVLLGFGLANSWTVSE